MASCCAKNASSVLHTTMEVLHSEVRLRKHIKIKYNANLYRGISVLLKDQMKLNLNYDNVQCFHMTSSMNIL